MDTITTAQFRKMAQGLQTGGKSYMASAAKKVIGESRLARRAWSGATKLTASGLKRVARELAAADPKSFSGAKSATEVARRVLREEKSPTEEGSGQAWKERLAEKQKQAEAQIARLKISAHEEAALRQRVAKTGASYMKYDTIAVREAEYKKEKERQQRKSADGVDPRTLAKRAIDLAI